MVHSVFEAVGTAVVFLCIDPAVSMIGAVGDVIGNIADTLVAGKDAKENIFWLYSRNSGKHKRKITKDMDIARVEKAVSMPPQPLFWLVAVSLGCCAATWIRNAGLGADSNMDMDF